MDTEENQNFNKKIDINSINFNNNDDNIEISEEYEDENEENDIDYSNISPNKTSPYDEEINLYAEEYNRAMEEENGAYDEFIDQFFINLHDIENRYNEYIQVKRTFLEKIDYLTHMLNNILEENKIASFPLILCENQYCVKDIDNGDIEIGLMEKIKKREDNKYDEDGKLKEEFKNMSYHDKIKENIYIKEKISVDDLYNFLIKNYITNDESQGLMVEGVYKNPSWSISGKLQRNYNGKYLYVRMIKKVSSSISTKEFSKEIQEYTVEDFTKKLKKIESDIKKSKKKMQNYNLLNNVASTFKSIFKENKIEKEKCYNISICFLRPNKNTDIPSTDMELEELSEDKKNELYQKIAIIVDMISIIKAKLFLLKNMYNDCFIQRLPIPFEYIRTLGIETNFDEKKPEKLFKKMEDNPDLLDKYELTLSEKKKMLGVFKYCINNGIIGVDDLVLARNFDNYGELNLAITLHNNSKNITTKLIQGLILLYPDKSEINQLMHDIINNDINYIKNNGMYEEKLSKFINFISSKLMEYKKNSSLKSFHFVLVKKKERKTKPSVVMYRYSEANNNDDDDDYSSDDDDMNIERDHGLFDINLQ